MLEEMNLPQIPDAASDFGDEWAFGEEVKFRIEDITSHKQAKSCQGKNTETAHACTLIGALNQIIKLFNLNLSAEESDKLGIEVVNYATQFGYKIWSGRYTPMGINVVTKWRNAEGVKRFKKEPVFYVRLNHDHPTVKEALEKGHYVGFTYQLDFGKDRYIGLVDKKEYPKWYGHRTNFQRSQDVNTASGATFSWTQLWVHDNYFGRVNEYHILNIAPYIGKGMYPAVYLIMPESWKLGLKPEQTKANIAEEKAVNVVLGALSTAYEYVDSHFQSLFASLATNLRQRYPEARERISDKKKKETQLVVDTLSFARKEADIKRKEAYGLLAKELREEFDVS